MCPPLMTSTSVRSAAGLTIGCTSRTLAATQRGREEADKNDNWACLGCDHLNDEKKRKDTLNPLTNTRDLGTHLGTGRAKRHVAQPP